ncbi:MAG: alpha/beta fold hydrolase, partial [Actinobacteria bacterium]|nr:alpha/beta fold hydrolase [Actinomycetota bacterium]
MKRFVVALVAAGLVLGVVPARADHVERDVCPTEPTREFPSGFRLPIDHQAEICRNESVQWKDKHVGGWGGGDCPADHKKRTPVVLVHGTTADAWFWRAASETADGTITNVRERLIRDGYCPAEIWAISYTGDGNPRGSYGAGYYTYNDVNADEVWQFIMSVRDFTGAPVVDVVGHSLGVTVVRKGMFLHRHDAPDVNPYDVVRRAVMIAGGNHGTTVCRGGTVLHPSHVCDEVDPDSPWLTDLNSIGESPGPTKWMSICDCLAADQFYEGPDIESPLLAGSVQLRLPGTPHITLARGKVSLDRYVPFLVEG